MKTKLLDDDKNILEQDINKQDQSIKNNEIKGDLEIKYET